jgi:hypothetical protein
MDFPSSCSITQSLGGAILLSIGYRHLDREIKRNTPKWVPSDTYPYPIRGQGYVFWLELAGGLRKGPWTKRRSSHSTGASTTTTAAAKWLGVSRVLPAGTTVHSVRRTYRSRARSPREIDRGARLLDEFRGASYRGLELTGIGTQ